MAFLDKKSFIPLYYQLAQLLREQIVTGTWASGAEIPSERKLMEQYGLSRNTVRQAMDLLYHDGLILREQGSGTRVAQFSNSYQYLLDTFYENRDLLLRAGYSPKVDTIASEVVFPPEVARLALKLEKNSPVLNKKLIFYADGRPAMYTLDYMPQSMTGEYDLSPEGIGFMNYLDHASGKRVEYVMIDLSPVEATGEVAATFNCPPGSPVLLMKEIFLDESQKIPIAFSMNYFNQKLVNFRLLTRRGDSPDHSFPAAQE
jgi:DNA-binding GntR family transcriptional regulator